VRLRAAVFVLFASFGTVLATWAVHLPTLQRRTDISTAQLGTVLLVLGLGSLLSMQAVGPLIDRFGSGIVAAVGGSAMALTVTAPLAATTFWQAAVGAVVFGVAVGAADVAMNAAAVAVERDYGRPIMASFHAVFSIGTVAGSLVAAAAFSVGVSVTTETWIVATVCAVAVLGAAPVLLRLPRDDPPMPTRPGGRTRTGRPRSRRVLVLGVLAFLLLLSEGSAMDWSSLHAQQHLGTSPTMGALAFGTFVTAMTVGRFSVDRVAQHIGSARVLRWGAAAAAVGIIVVTLSPVLPLTLLGWIMFGLGLSGGVPQVLSAAGNVSGASGRALSRVVGLGYVAILAGPAVIGWLAEVTSLNTAFVVPLCAVLTCALAAGAVTSSTPTPHDRVE
jgi:MFS family permease